jgi:hypothetical protein
VEEEFLNCLFGMKCAADFVIAERKVDMLLINFWEKAVRSDGYDAI